MKNLLAIILASLVVLALTGGCSKDELETSSAVTTPQTTTSTPAAAVTTTSSPSPFPTTTTPGSGEAEDLPVYSWEEAFDHFNETATVTGPVVLTEEVTYTGDIPFVHLLLGTEDTLTGGVLIQLEVDLESLPEDLYLGHTIAVTGNILEMRSFEGEINGARIYVDDLSQIEIIE